MYEIYFYQTNKPYGCFSNFSKHSIILDGKEWPTVEHYFQAQKFYNTEYGEQIRMAKTPMIAAQMGRDYNKPLREDWEIIKEMVMIKALEAKINQHEDVKQILLSTGDCILIEHTSNDKYWGDGGDRTGLNRLGHLLMKIRNALPEYSTTFYTPQWVAYPEHEPYDMFWRMGKGENYVMHLAKWFMSLSEEAQNEYNNYFVPPLEWRENI